MRSAIGSERSASAIDDAHADGAVRWRRTRSDSNGFDSRRVATIDSRSARRLALVPDGKSREGVCEGRVGASDRRTSGRARDEAPSGSSRPDDAVGADVALRFFFQPDRRIGGSRSTTPVGRQLSRAGEIRSVDVAPAPPASTDGASTRLAPRPRAAFAVFLGHRERHPARPPSPRPSSPRCLRRRSSSPSAWPRRAAPLLPRASPRAPAARRALGAARARSSSPPPRPGRTPLPRLLRRTTPSPPSRRRPRPRSRPRPPPRPRPRPRLRRPPPRRHGPGRGGARRSCA